MSIKFAASGSVPSKKLSKFARIGGVWCNSRTVQIDGKSVEQQNISIRISKDLEIDGQRVENITLTPGMNLVAFPNSQYKEGTKLPQFNLTIKKDEASA